METVVVFGGSGFLGIEIAKVLASHGYKIRIAVRNLENPSLQSLKKLSDNFEFVYADIRDETSIALAIKGCQSVINAVGLYVETASETFEAVHELGALNMAHQCQSSAAKRLILVSGIGVDLYSNSPYVRARAKGELLTQDVFPKATILRPSAIFGTEDKLVNSIANILRYAPIFPLLGNGQLKLQPVYVGDVAKAVAHVLKHDGTSGQIYELGGPTVYSYRQFIELIAEFSQRKRILVPVPFLVWEFMALLTSVLPRPPITRDTIALLKKDNIVTDNAFSLRDLSINPTPLEKILPNYDL